MPHKRSADFAELGKLLADARAIAKRYRELTQRPLGITGEVAEYEAARLLNLQLAPAREAGYDAIRERGGKPDYLQIKGRCILSKNPGQRIGKIDLSKPWDGVLLVLLDADFEPTEIYEARRHEIEQALTKPGSRARNERGALAVSKFKSIGTRVWHRVEIT